MDDRDKAYLLDVLESAGLALAYVEGKPREDLASEPQLQDAVIRRLEVVGEAASRVSESVRLEMADVPWQEMVGMRNFLIHGYGDIDLTVVWDTLQSDLPPLVTMLDAILGDAR